LLYVMFQRLRERGFRTRRALIPADEAAGDD